MSPLRRRMIEDMQIRNLTPNTTRVTATSAFATDRPVSGRRCLLGATPAGTAPRPAGKIQ
jgi:hypothetical protein